MFHVVTYVASRHFVEGRSYHAFRVKLLSVGEPVQFVFLEVRFDLTEAHLDGVELGAVNSIPDGFYLQSSHGSTHTVSLMHAKVVKVEQ